MSVNAVNGQTDIFMFFLCKITQQGQTQMAKPKLTFFKSAEQKVNQTDIDLVSIFIFIQFSSFEY